MKKEELTTVKNANNDLFLLASKLSKRADTEGTKLDKVIAELLETVTYLLDEIENLENCKPF